MCVCATVELRDSFGLSEPEEGRFTLGALPYALLNVFLEVGEITERVSRRRLVELLPKVVGKDEVLRDSLGLFEGPAAGGSMVGAGAPEQLIGDEGKTARDMVNDELV